MRNKRRTNSTSKAEALVGQSGYSGPIRLPVKAGMDDRIVRANLVINSALTSNGAGTVSGYFDSGAISSSIDWSNYAGLYSEYRILGIRFDWVPFYDGSYNASMLQGAGAWAVWHNGSGSVPASLDEVTSQSTYKALRSSTPSSMELRFRGFEELQWITTSSTPTYGNLRFYISGLTPSTTYGRLMATYLVEFRSRQ